MRRPVGEEGTVEVDDRDVYRFVSARTREQLNGGQIIRREPLALSNALDSALYRIVSTFYKHLHQFSLPRQYAERLKRYAAFEQ